MHAIMCVGGVAAYAYTQICCYVIKWLCYTKYRQKQVLTGGQDLGLNGSNVWLNKRIQAAARSVNGDAGNLRL